MEYLVGEHYKASTSGRKKKNKFESISKKPEPTLNAVIRFIGKMPGLVLTSQSYKNNAMPVVYVY